MTPETTEWLFSKVPELRNLDEEEINVIIDFSMLWSLFEGTELGANCNLRTIREYAAELEQRGRLHACGIDEYLPYLKRRYYVNGELTDHFYQLHIKRSGNPAEVVEALCNAATTEKVKFIGCLAIVFRLRNNLFHGEKCRIISTIKRIISCMRIALLNA